MVHILIITFIKLCYYAKLMSIALLLKGTRYNKMHYVMFIIEEDIYIHETNINFKETTEAKFYDFTAEEFENSVINVYKA